MDLTEAENIKKRWQESQKNYTKNVLMTQIITQIEPGILECEVKWGLRSITTNKASGGEGIPAELFKILTDDAVKVLCQKIWKTQQWSQDWQTQFSSQSQKKQYRKMFKLPHVTLHSFHVLARYCSKFFKLGFSSV